MATRAKQTLVVGVGALLAAVMVVLGLWQMQVFVDKGDRTVEARAEQPAVPLLDHIAPDGTVGDIYGKRVTVTGEYLPDQQLLLSGDGRAVRVLTAFGLRDGRVLPIVRGATTNPAGVSPAPRGERTETGLFLPGEGDVDVPPGGGKLGSVWMPLLQQKWPQRLTPGFVTLDEAGAATYGLTRADVTLPHGDGSVRNGGYALQWWVFAAFALGMSLKVSQTLGEGERRAREAAALTDLADAQPAAGEES